MREDFVYVTPRDSTGLDRGEAIALFVDDEVLELEPNPEGLAAWVDLGSATSFYIDDNDYESFLQLVKSE